jgi:hypothetical protein
LQVKFPEDEDVAGLVFSRLLQRKPGVGQELSKLRANLLEEAEGSSGTNLKVRGAAVPCRGAPRVPGVSGAGVFIDF